MNNRIFYIPKEKKQFLSRKKKYNLRMVASFVMVAVMLVLVFFGVRWRALQIEKISISGLSAIQEEDVNREISSVLSGSFVTGLIPYRFLLIAPAGTIIARIKEKFPLISDVEIKKEFPNTLAVTVTERRLFGVLCNDGIREGVVPEQGKDIQCAYLDTNGIAYQKAPKTEGFLIMKVSTDAENIPLEESAVDSAAMRRMIALNHKLPSIIGSPILGYQLLRNSSHELRAVTKPGFVLIMKQDGDMDALFYILKTVLEKEIGSKRKSLDYIDLRFGNKVFYKFK